MTRRLTRLTIWLARTAGRSLGSIVASQAGKGCTEAAIRLGAKRGREARGPLFRRQPGAGRVAYGLALSAVTVLATKALVLIREWPTNRRGMKTTEKYPTPVVAEWISDDKILISTIVDADQAEHLRDLNRNSRARLSGRYHALARSMDESISACLEA